MRTKANLFATGLLLAAISRCFGQPVITAQPQDQTNYVGTTATFTVVVTGIDPLSYQWQKYTTAFTDLTDRTNAVLNLSNVQTNDATDYRVVVTDATGSTNSAAAHLYVSAPEKLFISQPAPGLVTLSWQGSMVLLKAGETSGSLDCAAWMRVAGTSPVTLPVGSDSQFFKLVALPSDAEIQTVIMTNFEACRGGSVGACEVCVSAYFLTAPAALGTLPPSAAMEEAAVDGISLGSCILPGYLHLLSGLRGP